MAVRTEAKDTYRQVIKAVAHTHKHDKNTRGISPRNTPAEVATPFPPLNLKKIVQLCPATTPIAQLTLKVSVAGPNSIGINVTAASPFKISRIKV